MVVPPFFALKNVWLGAEAWAAQQISLMRKISSVLFSPRRLIYQIKSDHSRFSRTAPVENESFVSPQAFSVNQLERDIILHCSF